MLEETVERRLSEEYPSLDPGRVRKSSFSQGSLVDRREPESLSPFLCQADRVLRTGMASPSQRWNLAAPEGVCKNWKWKYKVPV